LSYALLDLRRERDKARRLIAAAQQTVTVLSELIEQIEAAYLVQDSQRAQPNVSSPAPAPADPPGG
jgi:hypothetical protein